MPRCCTLRPPHAPPAPLSPPPSYRSPYRTPYRSLNGSCTGLEHRIRRRRALNAVPAALGRARENFLPSQRAVVPELRAPPQTGAEARRLKARRFSLSLTLSLSLALALALALALSFSHTHTTHAPAHAKEGRHLDRLRKLLEPRGVVLRVRARPRPAPRAPARASARPPRRNTQDAETPHPLPTVAPTRVPTVHCAVVPPARGAWRPGTTALAPNKPVSMHGGTAPVPWRARPQYAENKSLGAWVAQQRPRRASPLRH